MTPKVYYVYGKDWSLSDISGYEVDANYKTGLILLEDYDRDTQFLKSSLEVANKRVSELEAENALWKSQVKWHNDNLDGIKDSFANVKKQDNDVIEKLQSDLNASETALRVAEAKLAKAVEQRNEYLPNDSHLGWSQRLGCKLDAELSSITPESITASIGEAAE